MCFYICDHVYVQFDLDNLRGVWGDFIYMHICHTYISLSYICHIHFFKLS